MAIYELGKNGLTIPKIRNAENLLYGDGNANEVIEIALADLHPSPINRKVDKTSDEYKELLESIKKSGVNTPLTVRKISSGFEILSGHHRAEAARESGMTQVPCIVKEATDDEAAVIIYESNIRVAVKITDKAKAFANMLEAYRRMERTEENTGIRTVDLMAEQTDVSRATIQRLLRINALIPELQEKLDAGAINLKQGVSFSYLDPASQRAVLTALEEGIKIDSSAAEKIRANYENKGSVTGHDITDLLVSDRDARKKKKDKKSVFPKSIRKYFREETDEEIEHILLELLEKRKNTH